MDAMNPSSRYSSVYSGSHHGSEKLTTVDRYDVRKVMTSRQFVSSPAVRWSNALRIRAFYRLLEYNEAQLSLYFQKFQIELQ